jgi:hypothetical protein
MLSKILDYNDLFAKGVSFIYALSNDHYLEDLAEKNSYHNGEQFIEDLNSIWLESYKKPYQENSDDFDQAIKALGGTLEELKKLATYNRKQFESNDGKEAKTLLENLNNYVGELSMFYDANNQPLYDLESIERIITNQKDNLLKSRGKKSRKALYNEILDAVESCKFPSL